MENLALERLREQLRLPVIVAPMFLVSGPALVVACCRNGIVGSLPASNARSSGELALWLDEITMAGAKQCAPYAINIVLDDTRSDRFQQDMLQIERFRTPIVITSVGPPDVVADRVHAYGGLVFHDVLNERHAHKAIQAGVDGLILLTAGAGGHTGNVNPFGFVPLIRKQFGGAILLAGAISNGQGILAARALGADFAYMGTRFAATQESLASPRYKELLVTQALSDVITTDRISGLSATFLRHSIRQTGLDPDDLPPSAGLFKPQIPSHIKAWRDIWSAGHGVGMIDDLPPVERLVARLCSEYSTAAANLS